MAASEHVHHCIHPLQYERWIVYQSNRSWVITHQGLLVHSEVKGLFVSRQTCLPDAGIHTVRYFTPSLKHLTKVFLCRRSVLSYTRYFFNHYFAFLLVLKVWNVYNFTILMFEMTYRLINIFITGSYVSLLDIWSSVVVYHYVFN